MSLDDKLQALCNTVHNVRIRAVCMALTRKAARLALEEAAEVAGNGQHCVSHCGGADAAADEIRRLLPPGGPDVSGD